MNALQQANSKESTKEKILNVAYELFSRKGFDGTSIRDIAKEAEVNLGAVNYHFQSKDRLYFEVFQHSIKWVDKQITEISDKKNMSVLKLAVETLNFFLQNQNAMRNIFKLFLNDNFPMLDDIPKDQLHFCPPGEEAFMKLLQKEYGDKIPPQAQIWVIKNIFSLVNHFGLISSTTYYQKLCKEIPQAGCVFDETSISHHVNATIEYALANPEKFDHYKHLYEVIKNSKGK
ncbi:MAG: TetR/AcrR family transcriptional regulator [Halobacteriovoraceae bacterium]|nr:TetR/AcrR family transcriptional regulator [Halobacteriovoraceae bacterium]